MKKSRLESAPPKAANHQTRISAREASQAGQAAHPIPSELPARLSARCPGGERWLSQLSPNRRQLVHLMQQTWFGHILCLHVFNGEPVFEPAPGVVREVLLGDGRSVRSATVQRDFVLRDRVLDLFEQLDMLGTGLVEALEIQNGLPFRVRMRGNMPSGAPGWNGEAEPGSSR